MATQVFFKKEIHSKIISEITVNKNISVFFLILNYTTNLHTCLLNIKTMPFINY